jgi:TorA maturation chaperone TorD/Pyruvate/2-oxoacid:ferredoxin oxidoreductase delta subunit
MNANTARQRSRTYVELASAFSEPEPGLEQEFTRLFLGPGRPVAHPFESVYREGRTMGDTTLDVRRRLTEEGLAPSKHVLPDHLGIELAFMARLATSEARAWETGDDDGARDYLGRQASFLYDHLTAWLPQFCHRVLAGRPVAHYAGLARDAETYVLDDAARVQAWLSNGSAAPTGVVTRQESWTVSIVPGCTLCDICAQVCQPGALRLVRDVERALVVLRFETSHCDGCAACQRWCPEHVIGVSPVVAGERPAGDELAWSTMLACPRCGQLHAPEAMVTKVQHLVDSGLEALLQRLTLCHDCKAKDIPLRRGGTTQ